MAYIPTIRPKQTDNINSPSHYTAGSIEVIDFIQAKLSVEEFKGYLKGNIIKYLSRASYKGKELEDFKKAQWYLNRLIERMEAKQ